LQFHSKYNLASPHIYSTSFADKVGVLDLFVNYFDSFELTLLLEIYRIVLLYSGVRGL